jgi:tetratricopeptide (TPR) repeat protein
MSMARRFAFFLWIPAVLAQAPQQQPLEAAMQCYWSAVAAGRFEEAAAKRDEARRLLNVLPVQAPEFARQAQQIASFYESAGRSIEARDVLQQALARASVLVRSDPARITLLSALSDFWQRDRNLLKALECQEQAVAALDGAPDMAGPVAGSSRLGSYARSLGTFAVRFSSPGFSNNPYLYQRLADLYRQLGRRDSLAALLVRLRKTSGTEAMAALLYDQNEQSSQAAAIYQAQAAHGLADPQQSVSALQSLSSLYQRQQRYGEAIAALEQALATASTLPEMQNQTVWMRQNLAMVLQQAGQTLAADRIYTQLLDESRLRNDGSETSLLSSYSNHLAATQRAPQAEEILKDYLDGHGGLQPWEESNVLFALANVARLAGQPARAEEYQTAAMEKQQSAQSLPPGQISIQKLLQDAQQALGRSNPDEAYRLAIQALDQAPLAGDRDLLGWQVPNIADGLAAAKAFDQADQLYRRAFPVVEQWSAVAIDPLVQLQQCYARFLMNQNRQAEVPDAIERFRSTLLATRGPDTGRLAEALHLSIDAARFHGAPEQALPEAEQLLALEESLAGETSEPYLHAVELLAELHESTGNLEHALLFRRKAIAILDERQPNDVSPAQARSVTAFVLARLNRFDEAEQLLNEALTFAQRLDPPQPDQFLANLQQLGSMKAAAQRPVTSRWFNPATAAIAIAH